MFAALIGGFISFLNLISSKEITVSSFRQDWINSLRNSISQYISSIYNLANLKTYNLELKEGQHNDYEILKTTVDINTKINMAYNDIILRINDKEIDPEANDINSHFLDVLEASRLFYNNRQFQDAKNKCGELRE